jgi:hypothetical protein
MYLRGTVATSSRACETDGVDGGLVVGPDLECACGRRRVEFKGNDIGFGLTMVVN